jgi:hypothetical protein
MKPPIFLLWLASILISFATPVRATNIEVGLGNTNNVFPFSPDYVGEYQQIYSSSAFSQAFLISAVAFETDIGNFVSSASYNFTLSLGITSRTPGNPGSSYSGTFSPVFSGPLTVNYTGAGNFDFVVPLSVPFLYNPMLGNLLMDIVINSPSSDQAIFAASESDPQMGRVYNFDANGAATAGPNEGLDTRFTGSASVPDADATVLLLGFNMLWIASVQRTLDWRKAARRCVQSHQLRAGPCETVELGAND